MSLLGSSLSSGSRNGLSNPVASISEWYKTLTDPQAKSIKALQIRKDVRGAVPHRFIVLRMCDNRVHRFDRRPAHGPDGEANLVGVLANRAVTSQDSYVLDISLSEEERASQCEIELLLNGRVDLSTVISACSAISSDTSAGQYTFLRHNCFFFSWTILMVVSRHSLPYEVPLYESVMPRFQSELDQLTSFIVDEAVALFLDLVIDTMEIFREKAGASLRKALDVLGRAACALPINRGVPRFLWRQLFTVRLHFGLRAQLTKMVKSEITRTVKSIYEATLSTHMTPDIINEHLWIEETKGTVKKAIEEETMKVLWESILEAISAGLGNITPEQLANQLTDPNLKFSLLGRGAVQFFAVWNAVLHGGLQAAKGAGQDLAGLSHADAFDRAWFAARDAALSAAQTVVKSTSATMNKPERDEMWASIWEIWDDCWDEAHKITQPQSVRVVEKVLEALVATESKVVIEVMRESKARTIQAYMPRERKWLSRHWHRKSVQSSITNARLQEYMQNIIKKDTVNTETLEAVRSSMERIWRDTRQHLSVSNPLDAITEHSEA